jgi:colicin import membrane protein
MKHIFIVAALALSMNSHAATQDLDQLLNKIEADIKAQRLAKPTGNNALEGIDAFRAQAPFDFRITPLIYKFGESYVSLANKAIAKKKYGQAQGYLDIAWQVAALTPGLEEAQAKNDKLNSGKAKPKAVKKGPSAAERKQQKAIAAAAAAEKKRLDNERKKKAQADKNAKVAASKKSQVDKRAKQEAEKKRRLAANKAQKNKTKAASDLAQRQKLDKQLAAAEAEKLRLEALANKPAVAVTTIARETSSPIASYPLAQDKIDNRNRMISEDLAPICEAIIDNDASIVLHTNTKADYRWLTVRLTLCTRRLDSSFRLRHSFQEVSNEGAFITLHPARNTALIGSTLD